MIKIGGISLDAIRRIDSAADKGMVNYVLSLLDKNGKYTFPQIVEGICVKRDGTQDLDYINSLASITAGVTLYGWPSDAIKWIEAVTDPITKFDSSFEANKARENKLYAYGVIAGVFMGLAERGLSGLVEDELEITLVKTFSAAIFKSSIYYQPIAIHQAGILNISYARSQSIDEARGKIQEESREYRQIVHQAIQNFVNQEVLNFSLGLVREYEVCKHNSFLEDPDRKSQYDYCKWLIDVELGESAIACLADNCWKFLPIETKLALTILAPDTERLLTISMPTFARAIGG